MRVLIAEDNPDNLDMLRRRLQRKGFDVLAATDGRQAVTAVAENNPDIVLMDVSMPVLSGIEATEAIRANETGEHPRTPIIALTAHAMTSDRNRCLEAGCDAYATKPVDFSALLKIIAELTEAEYGAER